MNKFEKMYEEKKMTAEQALSLIQDYDYMFSAQAAGEPAAIMSKLQYLKETGVKNTTLNTCLPLQYYDAFKDPEMKGIMSHNGWFFSAGLRDAHGKKLVSASPQSSTSILRKVLSRLEYEKRRPVVLATVSPMDKHGYMTLSVSAIYERDLINAGALTIVEVKQAGGKYGDCSNGNMHYFFIRGIDSSCLHNSENAPVIETNRLVDHVI